MHLAPLAVRPDCQRQGIGMALTRAGLNACRLAAIEAVVVLGDPGYYSRLGFSAERASHIESRWSGEAFMALELVEGALESHHLIANYPAAFLELQ